MQTSYWRGKSPHSKHVLALILFPSKAPSSATGSLWLNASLCTSSPLSSSFCGHPLADAVSSSPPFHSSASAFMVHCVFAERVQERGRGAEGGLRQVQLPHPTTWVIFSHPACDPLPLCRSWLESNLPFSFLFYFILKWFLKKKRVEDRIKPQWCMRLGN